MKKIFTLLFAVGLFTVAQAQPGRDRRDRDDDRYEHRDRDNDDRYENGNRYGNSRFGDERRMRVQIAQINREYDYKMQRVSNDRYTSRWEKDKLFRRLEDQRRQEIRRVYQQFKYKQRYDDRDFQDRRHNY